MPDLPEYSSDVRLRFESGGREWALASTGPDFIVPRDEMFLPAWTIGDVVVVVDGKQSRYRVRLIEEAIGTGVVPTGDVT